MRERIEEVLEKLKNKNPVSLIDLENLLLDTYTFLDSRGDDEYNLCLAVICHVANTRPQDAMVQQLLHDCIIKSRVFLYDDLLKKQMEYNPQFSFQDTAAMSFYTSRNTNTTLTKSQKEILSLFQERRRIVVGAPTSFGKTRIIREIIAHNAYRRIVIIVPTVSLLSEQYKELNDSVDGFIISKSSKIEVCEDKKYILILTPERMSIFMEENPLFNVDFFVMDEIYKTDYKLQDDRFRVFSDILYRLAKTRSHFYLIGPYLSGFSKQFCEKFGVSTRLFKTEIVQKDFFFFGKSNKGVHVIGENKLRFINDKSKNLIRILEDKSVDGKFLIYRYQKQYVESTAKKIADAWPIKSYNSELSEYLAHNVSPEWDLIDCLKKGVGFHHGAMPRHIQDLIIDEFNNENGICHLVCTTSLTEGVNTSAKNVILYDNKIGAGERLKYLDRKNIEGRAGRFMRHFVGRVIYLEDSNQTDEETFVEMEYLDNMLPADETLIQTDDVDLSEDKLTRKDDIRRRLEKYGIPLDLIRSNRFVDIDGQIKIFQLLDGDGDLMRTLFFDGSLPTVEVNRKILSLAYDHLFTQNNKGRRYGNDVGKWILIGLTNYYLYKSPSFSELIHSETVMKQGTINARIRYVFDLKSKYFEFIWPRYLKAFESIYNFIAEKNGFRVVSLDMIVAKMEYGTTKPHEIILRDMGIPNEMIRKISKYFSDCANFDDVQSVRIHRSHDISLVLTPIEIRILNRYI